LVKPARLDCHNFTDEKAVCTSVKSGDNLTVEKRQAASYERGACLKSEYVKAFKAVNMVRTAPGKAIRDFLLVIGKNRDAKGPGLANQTEGTGCPL
jgi:hypothetical protein